MKNPLHYLICGFYISMMFSCTVVTSTNRPGKSVSKTPGHFIGKYELILTEDMKLFMGDDYRMSVQFTKDKLLINDGYNTSALLLNDSVFISKIKKNYYLSLGVAPAYSVLKMRQYGKDLYLFPMFLEADRTASDVAPYFSAAVDVPGEPDENGEMTFPSVSVTIDDSKLEKFFSSVYCVSDSFQLKWISKSK